MREDEVLTSSGGRSLRGACPSNFLLPPRGLGGGEATFIGRVPGGITCPPGKEEKNLFSTLSSLFLKESLRYSKLLIRLSAVKTTRARAYSVTFTALLEVGSELCKSYKHIVQISQKNIKGY